MSRRRPRGFSFTEILFAVMILGIGFIMVAAMFPVAIHQTETANRETIAASLGRAGAGYMEQIAAMPWPPGAAAGAQTTSMLVPTLAVPFPLPSSIGIPVGRTSVVVPGQVWSMYDSRDVITSTTPAATHKPLLWQAIANNLIQPGDPRFGWVAMYRRDLIYEGPSGGPALTYRPAPYAQIIILAVQAQTKPLYNPASDIPNPPTPLLPTPFLPQFVTLAQLTPPAAAGSSSQITLTSLATAEDTYIIVSDDHNGGALNGRIYRVGISLGAGSWSLAPGQDMSVTDPVLNNADVFLVGKGLDPNNPGQFGGTAQDVSVYTTYVSTN